MRKPTMMWEGRTRAQVNRHIRKQLRRAALTPVERKLRRALLRLRQGSVNLAQIQGEQ